MTVRTYDEGYFNSSHILSSYDGIQFAFAITDFDSNELISEDLDYGRVVAKIRSWGQKGDSKQISQDERELSSQICEPGNFTDE